MAVEGESSPWIVKLLILALVGFIAVTVIRPLLHLVMTLAFFAALGYISWRLLTWLWAWTSDSEPESPSPLMGKAKRWKETSEEIVRRAAPTVKEKTQRTARWMAHKARIVTAILTEMICGGAVGALLGVIARWEQPQQVQYALLGAAIGAFLGVVVGSSKVASLPETEQTSS